MTFKVLVLYDLTKYLATEDDTLLARIHSLCRSFSIDVPRLLAQFSTPSNARLIAKVLNCKEYATEVDLCLPEDAMRTLVRLKLRNRTRTVRRCARLTPTMRGAAYVIGRTVHLHCANEELQAFMEAEYSPTLYRHVSVPALILRPRCKLYMCAVPVIPYYACLVGVVFSNMRARAVLSETCIDALVSEENEELLRDLFMSGSNTAFNRALRHIYCFLRGGQMPNGASSIDLVSCS